MKRKPEPLGPFSVLTRGQLASWLQVSERTLDRLNPPPPSLALTVGTKRYLLSDVVSWLQSRRNGNAA